MKYKLLRTTRAAVLRKSEMDQQRQQGQQDRPGSAPTSKELGYEAEVWEELDDLYRGGYVIQAKAKKYLPRAVGEHKDRHAERQGLASYINFLGPTVNAYQAALFEKPLSVQPASDAEDTDTPGTLPDPEVWSAFARDADLRGRPFSAVMAQAALDMTVKHKALIAIDFPRVAGEPANKAEGDALGAGRPYAWNVPAEELINWEVSNEIQRTADLGDGIETRWTIGRFSWVILRRIVAVRPSPDEDTKTFEEYRVWKRDPESGTVSWELYKVEIGGDSKVSDDDDLSPEDSGDSTFREIPLVEIRAPEALWIGGQVGPLNLEHWRRRSALISAQQRNLIPMAVVRLGSEIPGVGQALPAERAQDPGRADDLKAKLDAQGYVVMGAGDDVSFPGPDVAAFTVVDGQLKDLVDTIHQVSGRMAASITSQSTGVARSGASKAFDLHDFAIVCKALGALLTDGAHRVYTIASEARKDDVRWTVSGLSGYEPNQSLADILAELTALGAAPIRSKAARAALETQRVLAMLPGADPDLRTTIRDEIGEANQDGKPQIDLPPTMQGYAYTLDEYRRSRGDQPMADGRGEKTFGEAMNPGPPPQPG